MIKIKLSQSTLLGIKIEFNSVQDFSIFSEWLKRGCENDNLNIFNQSFSNLTTSSNSERRIVSIICDLQTAEILKQQAWNVKNT